LQLLQREVADRRIAIISATSQLQGVSAPFQVARRTVVVAPGDGLNIALWAGGTLASCSASPSLCLAERLSQLHPADADDRATRERGGGLNRVRRVSGTATRLGRIQKPQDSEVSS
jgi:hypothetical protein